jgi:hypothetical protein
MKPDRRRELAELPAHSNNEIPPEPVYEPLKNKAEQADND